MFGFCSNTGTLSALLELLQRFLTTTATTLGTGASVVRHLSCILHPNHRLLEWTLRALNVARASECPKSPTLAKGMPFSWQCHYSEMPAVPLAPETFTRNLVVLPTEGYLPLSCWLSTGSVFQPRPDMCRVFKGMRRSLKIF